MSNWIHRVALAVLLPVAVACGGDSNGASNDAGEMTATIDGSPFEGDLDVQAFFTNGTLSISGMDQVSRRITLVIPAAAVGTFAMGPNQITSATLYFGSITWITNPSGSSGSVTIATLTDDHATGTFQFTAKATDPLTATQFRTVTNGTFDVRF